MSQCIRQGEKNDNQFTCLNRADENPFLPQSITRSSNLDLSVILTNCTVSSGLFKGFPGLTCPNILLSSAGIDGMAKCVQYAFWCKNDFPIHCDYGHIDFVTADPQVCKNASFWQQHANCGDPYYKRCNGTNPGNCIEVNSEEKCDEKLDDRL